MATPIIDIHTHTFNARYLPLRGILLGKRDAGFPITTLISDDCAMLIAQGVVDRTELAAIPGQSAIARKPDTTDLRSMRPGLICKIFLSIIEDAIENDLWAANKTARQQVQAVDKMVERMNLVQRLGVKATANMMGMHDHIKGADEGNHVISGIKAFMRFLWTLTQNDAEIEALYHALHENVPKAGRITIISHMMDLGPVYDQAPNGEALLDFRGQQVPRMEHYQNQPNSELSYFVAYNPYRRDGLDVVRDAIDHHGAIGVKVYPPSGYRAAGNKIKRRPFALFTRYPGRQWDARYSWLGPDKNKALDEQLARLLEWCIARDVPIVVHSGYGEFEARKGYGEHHSNPKFWKQFLESHSTPGQPCPLRLCLAHAGGEDHWFGMGKHGDWGKLVAELCAKYPNVYCEVTTSEKMLEPTTQAHFVDRLAELFANSSGFANKILYGTDWPLPDRGEPDAVLIATQQAFLHPRLKSHYAGYFFVNAKQFLKLR